MDSSILRIRYRPVRIGWCIRDQNLDDLRSAMRLSCVFRGGIFNPIIPVPGSDSAEMVRRFRADVLWSINNDPDTKGFIAEFKSLPWPLHEEGLFIERFEQKHPQFLDVSHELRKIAAERQAYEPLGPHEMSDLLPESNPCVLLQWQDDDPLRDLLLAMFGGYPIPDDTGRDYSRFIQTNLRPTDWRVRECDQLPGFLLNKLTPSSITDRGLIWDLVPGEDRIGFYIGEAGNFDDLVNYWNLRACGIKIVFLDPKHLSRLANFKNEHQDAICRTQSNAPPSHGEIAVWSRRQDLVAAIGFPNDLVPYFKQVDGTTVLRGSMRPPLHYISEKRILASQLERAGRPALVFQLPEKPFAVENGIESREHFAVSVRPSFGESEGAYTFWTPFIPQLNRWLGRELHLYNNDIRAEREGVGVICPITTENLKLWAIARHDLAKSLFEIAGIAAKPSQAGRVASRLISQLGGLQGCRVLKIAGVRRLIKEHSATQEFGWDEAIQTISKGDAALKQPPFSEYQSLFIEQRDMTSKLQPADAFHYLLEKGVFRVGLSLNCPSCELAFWNHLDDVSTYAECAYCGTRFNIVRQLRKSPWRYRKSGLFGQDNNQEGSMPVAITLQQLDTQLRLLRSDSILLSNLDLAAGPNTPKCETDLFLAIQAGDRIEIAVGECKDAGGRIDSNDVVNMAAVADSFPTDTFDTYIVFSKTAPFTPEEIENCRVAQLSGGGYRVIMLSDRELEPYFAYERASKEFELDRSAVSLEDMAHNTARIYFSPKTQEA